MGSRSLETRWISGLITLMERPSLPSRMAASSRQETVFPTTSPDTTRAFHPAVPITLDTVAGNTITIDLGGGQFAYYFHLQPGSLRVKTGDRVRRGQMLARVGCSGDAREPHLHFEVTDSSKLIAGDGLTYVIDRYRTMSGGGGSRELRIRELPMNKNIVEFAGGREK
jgi:hypothetical protein